MRTKALPSLAANLHCEFLEIRVCNYLVPKNILIQFKLEG
jgi:hypothetical protein